MKDRGGREIEKERRGWRGRGNGYEGRKEGKVGEKEREKGRGKDKLREETEKGAREMEIRGGKRDRE